MEYQIAFYLDGVGFQYRANLFNQAGAPKAHDWCQRGEGLDHGCPAKGKKEGAVNCDFMVGVVLCEQYFGVMTIAKMFGIVDNSFEQVFQKSVNSKRRLF